MENVARRFTYDSKTSGDLIRSQDWNKAMQEIVDLGEDVGRLRDNTLSKAGGSLTGPLTVAAALQVHGTVQATRFEGDGSGLTGLTLSQWTATTTGRGIFYTSGPVGIGTATPTETLEIQGTVKATRFVGDGSGLTGLQDSGSSPSQWTTAANGAIYYAGGNVGIGTTPPAHALHVGGGKSVRYELGINQKLSLGGNGAFEIDAPNIVGGRLIVTDQGTVGIGVTAPTEKLEVAGTIKATRFVGDGSGLTGLQGGGGGSSQ